MKAHTNKKVNVDITNGIATITIDNPPVNAMSSEVIENLQTALTKVETSDAKVILLKGEGNNFVAGADIKELQNLPTKEEALLMSRKGHELEKRMERFHIPIIACIQGACLGGGLELALAAHVRIASDSAIFGLPETTLGIIPGAGGTQRLPKVVGISKAYEMILTGKKISAEEAKEFGIVSSVYNQSDFSAETGKLARNIAFKSKIALDSAVMAIQKGYLDSSHEGYELEIEKFAECCMTKDTQEGIDAFLNKRKPVFKNK